MSKVTTLSIIFLFGIKALSGQDLKKDQESVRTKMDVFSSKTGVITKFIDSNLPDMKTSFTAAETRVRKVLSGTSPTFFYQIVVKGKYSNTTASIEYSDLLEVIKAIKSLKADAGNDVALAPDYLENKFITVDGFEVGYYVSKAKLTWYLKLQKYGSDNTVFINDFEVIETAFNGAKVRIDELKK